MFNELNTKIKYIKKDTINNSFDNIIKLEELKSLLKIYENKINELKYNIIPKEKFMNIIFAALDENICHSFVC